MVRGQDWAGYHAWKANHIDGGRPKWHKVHGKMVSIKVQKEPKYFGITPSRKSLHFQFFNL
jgi:hypothetical protein